ncbi:MAG: hypothetical protein M9904_10805, partial [Chitinophagaceae bacterium]|nr:hypothetical protein [Chitinophagaceae bacterium]
LQSVTFQINGVDQKQYVEANPQFKTINIYDGGMKRVESRQSKKEQQSDEESQPVKQQSRKEKQAAPEDDGPELPKASRKRKRKQSIS